MVILATTTPIRQRALKLRRIRPALRSVPEEKSELVQLLRSRHGQGSIQLS
jgi:hypothetical protein